MMTDEEAKKCVRSLKKFCEETIQRDEYSEFMCDCPFLMIDTCSGNRCKLTLDDEYAPSEEWWC